MSDKNVYLITGAGRDIGQEIAQSLALNECFVVIHHANSSVGAEETLDQVQRNGGDGCIVKADFTKLEQLNELVGSVQDALGSRKLDGIVHNAAYTATSVTGALDQTALSNVLTANVTFPYLLTDALSTDLKDGASIVAISIAATDKVFSPDFGFFAASKAAINCLVRNWAIQLGPRRIRANAVAPGVVDANFRSDLLSDPAFRNALEEATALGRPGQIGDVAKVVRFLLSDESAWITGQIIEASGGWKL